MKTEGLWLVAALVLALVLVLGWFVIFASWARQTTEALTLIHTDLQHHNGQLETAAIWFKDRMESMGQCER